MEKNIDIRHYLFDNHMLMEAMIQNILASYFSENEELFKKSLFYVFQQNNFSKNISILRDIKIYEEDFITCSKDRFEKGMSAIDWINDKRNKISHYPLVKDEKINQLILQVSKKGNVNKMKIDKKFAVDLNKNIKDAVSLLSGLLHEIKKKRDFESKAKMSKEE
jgi:hypothetical protein